MEATPSATLTGSVLAPVGLRFMSPSCIQTLIARFPWRRTTVAVPHSSVLAAQNNVMLRRVPWCRANRARSGAGSRVGQDAA